jgi:hypothetical protein
MHTFAAKGCSSRVNQCYALRAGEEQRGFAKSGTHCKVVQANVCSDEMEHEAQSLNHRLYA